MNRQGLFFGIFTAAVIAVPTFAADGAPDMFAHRFGKNAFNFEGMPSGPQPLRNLSRLPNGKANAGRLVGDYNNPILTAEASAVVKQKGELAAAGRGFPNSQDQCRTIAPPFTFAMQLGLLMLPVKNGDIEILYDQNANRRHIRMNGSHPANIVPSSMGDSIGHWEGDTLVVDTTNFAPTSRFENLPATNLHTVERFTRTGPKTIQWDVTVNDPTIYTKPWTATMILRSTPDQIFEMACHEGNEGLSGALSGTRALEKAAETDAAKKGSR
jgi:hypothetical protein